MRKRFLVLGVLLTAFGGAFMGTLIFDDCPCRATIPTVEGSPAPAPTPAPATPTPATPTPATPTPATPTPATPTPATPTPTDTGAKAGLISVGGVLLTDSASTPSD